MLANGNCYYIERIIHHDELEFIPGIQDWFSIQKSILVIHYIYRLKKKRITYS